MKKRIISAIVALAIFVPLIIIGDVYFGIAMGILAVLAYKEVLDLKKSHGKIPNIIKILGLISLIYLVLGNYGEEVNFYLININQVILPLALLLIPLVFYDENKYSTKDAFYLLGFIYLIGLFFYIIISLRNIPGDNAGLYLFIYLFSITILTDTFAYIIGILIGKHKMCPTISPKKSWEGFFAGLIGGSVCASIAYANLIDELSFKIVLFTVLLSIIGQLGDLVFSRIKRENDIKDFSNIMPGHGGVLDRLDSIIIVVIVYIILINIF